MPHINLNFDEIPLKMEPIPTGVYTMKVNSAVLEPTKDGTGTRLTVELEVDDESNAAHGRTIRDYLSVKKSSAIGLNQLIRSCGLPAGPNGINTDELVGRKCQARIKLTPGKDKETGEIKEYSNVAEYLFQA